MKKIDIRKQPSMGLARTVNMTVHGIRYRLFRSLVTVVVIAVAIAFLMNILSESLIKKSTVELTEQRIKERRLAVRWLARLTSPGSINEIVYELAAGDMDAPYIRETLAISEMPREKVQMLHLESRKAAAYLDWFADLDYGKRRRLVYNTRGIDIFDRLQDAAKWERFVDQLDTLKTIRLVTDLDEFRTFLHNWPDIKADLERVQKARAAAIAQVQQAVAGRSILEALGEADGRFGDILAQTGFRLTATEAAKLTDRVRDVQDTGFLLESIGHPQVRSSVAAYRDLLPSEVTSTTMWSLAANSTTAAWYLEQLNEAGLTAPNPLKSDRFRELRRLNAEEQTLTKAAGLSETVSGGFLGIGERMTWLVVVSMLVCVVGIANAMLMSVTERFREIATLKCLGALDTFIMLVFVLEACALGVVGGIMGAVAGTLIGSLRMLVAFGGLMLAAFPGTALLLGMLLSVGVGVVLAGVAAVYPSMKAAKLAPMEAMRIE
jgi:hypothetical protein